MKIGIVPFGADRVEAKAYGRKSCQSGRTLCNGVAQQKGFSNSLLTVKVSGQPDSQLESRMQEICQSGSGGGAVLSRPYLIVRQHGKPGGVEILFSAGFSAIRWGFLGTGILFCFTLLPLRAAEPDVRQGESAAAAARPLAALFGSSEVDIFRKAVAGISDLQVFEGLPDPQTESILFAREASRSDVMRIGDFHFYKEPLPIGEAERLELRAIFHPGNPFSPGGGQDPCGRFHPDYLLVWKSGEETFSAQVGLGCQEIEALGPKLRIHRYIPPESYARLNKILGKCAVNRPSASN